MNEVADWTIIDGFEISFRQQKRETFVKKQLTIGYDAQNFCSFCGECDLHKRPQPLNVKFITKSILKKAINLATKRYDFENIVFAPMYGENLLHPNLSNIIEFLSDYGHVLLITSIPKKQIRNIYKALQISKKFSSVCYVFSLLNYKTIGNIDFIFDVPSNQLRNDYRMSQFQIELAKEVIKRKKHKDFNIELQPHYENDGYIYGCDIELDGIDSYWMYNALNYKIKTALSDDIISLEWKPILFK